MDISTLYTIYRSLPAISIDTRSMRSGEMLFCLKGPNFDANTFVEAALKNGAGHVVTENAQYSGEQHVTVVANALQCLQELAKYHRARFAFPVIGLTGSNGKTTNKELIAAVLSERYLTYATAGNLNNHIGVPLTLLQIPLDAEMAIIEMGANHQGEIRMLSDICDPDYGMITNIGKAHLEGFGGIEGVKKGKKELYDYISSRNRTAFVNADDQTLLEISKDINRVMYGQSAEADVQGQLIDADPFVRFWFKSKNYDAVRVHTQMIGAYNFPNLLTAACIGDFFKVDSMSIKKALESYVSKNNRSQLIKTEHNEIILDAYNANPSSMEVAIQNLAQSDAKNKIALLGQMLELGDDSQNEHQNLIMQLKKLDLKAVLVGDGFKHCDYSGLSFFENTSALIEFLKQNPLKDHFILIKGSRMVAMEKLMPLL